MTINPIKPNIISIFGSTGSIGVNALKIIQNTDIKVECLAANKNYELLNEQINIFKPKIVLANDEVLSKINHTNKYSIKDASLVLKDLKSDGIINSIVGFAGLKISLATQESGKNLFLANKESLVVAGKFLDCSKISPIDSEHSALAALLRGVKNPRKLIITASGGAFFKKSDLANLKANEALKHPNWSMGAKITIDSATMANKLYEIIEARHLYPNLSIDAIIEPSSSIHAFCECENGAMSAYFSVPDMKLSIANALLGECEFKACEYMDILKLAELRFYEIDKTKYPIFSLKDELLKNPDLGVIINAANEEFVYKYLDDKCGFYDISNAVFKALDKFSGVKINDISDVFIVDKMTREFVNA